MRTRAVEKLATVRIGNKSGYINREGMFFNRVGSFSEGLAAVQVGNKWGYVNTEGEIIIKPQFDEAVAFSKEGYISIIGKSYIGRRSTRAVEKLATVRVGNKSGYINREGMFFNQFKGFSEGLAAVQGGGKWGYINLIGEIVIKLQFDDAKNFSEGLARVRVDGKWGYINTEGEVVIKPQFDDAGGFTTVK